MASQVETQLFVQRLVQANNKENIKASQYWPIVKKKTPVTPLTKGQ